MAIDVFKKIKNTPTAELRELAESYGTSLKTVLKYKNQKTDEASAINYSIADQSNTDFNNIVTFLYNAVIKDAGKIADAEIEEFSQYAKLMEKYFKNGLTEKEAEYFIQFVNDFNKQVINYFSGKNDDKSEITDITKKYSRQRILYQNSTGNILNSLDCSYMYLFKNYFFENFRYILNEQEINDETKEVVEEKNYLFLPSGFAINSGILNKTFTVKIESSYYYTFNPNNALGKQIEYKKDKDSDNLISYDSETGKYTIIRDSKKITVSVSEISEDYLLIIWNSLMGNLNEIPNPDQNTNDSIQLRNSQDRVFFYLDQASESDINVYTLYARIILDQDEKDIKLYNDVQIGTFEIEGNISTINSNIYYIEFDSIKNTITLNNGFLDIPNNDPSEEKTIKNKMEDIIKKIGTIYFKKIDDKYICVNNIQGSDLANFKSLVINNILANSDQSNDFLNVEDLANIIKNYNLYTNLFDNIKYNISSFLTASIQSELIQVISKENNDETKFSSSAYEKLIAEGDGSFLTINLSTKEKRYIIFYKELNPQIQKDLLTRNKDTISAIYKNYILSSNEDEFISKIFSDQTSLNEEIESFIQKFENIATNNKQIYNTIYYLYPTIFGQIKTSDGTSFSGMDILGHMHGNCYKARTLEDLSIISYIYGDKSLSNSFGNTEYQLNKINKFLDIYEETRLIYFRNIRSNAFISEEFYNAYLATMISATAIDRYLNQEIIDINDLDVLSDDGIERFIRSYGLGELVDILKQDDFSRSAEYLRRLAKNYNNLVKNKGSHNIIKYLETIFSDEYNQLDIRRALLVRKLETDSKTTSKIQSQNLKFITLPFDADNVYNETLSQGSLKNEYSYDDFLNFYDVSKYWDPTRITETQLLESNKNIYRENTKYIGISNKTDIIYSYYMTRLRLSFAINKFGMDKLNNIKNEHSVAEYIYTICESINQINTKYKENEKNETNSEESNSVTEGQSLEENSTTSEKLYPYITVYKEDDDSNNIYSTIRYNNFVEKLYPLISQPEDKIKEDSTDEDDTNKETKSTICRNFITNLYNQFSNVEDITYENIVRFMNSEITDNGENAKKFQNQFIKLYRHTIPNSRYNDNDSFYIFIKLINFFRGIYLFTEPSNETITEIEVAAWLEDVGEYILEFPKFYLNKSLSYLDSDKTTLTNEINDLLDSMFLAFYTGSTDIISEINESTDRKVIDGAISSDKTIKEYIDDISTYSSSVYSLIPFINIKFILSTDESSFSKFFKKIVQYFISYTTQVYSAKTSLTNTIKSESFIVNDSLSINVPIQRAEYVFMNDTFTIKKLNADETTQKDADKDD